MRQSKSFSFKPALLFLILSAAFILRFGHFISMKAHGPVFDYPLVDSIEYVSDANYYLEQNWMGRCAAYPHPPMYPFFVAVLFKLFGNSPDAVKLAQILIDLINASLLYLIARKVFNQSIALIGACLYALYIPVIFYNTQILPLVLGIFFLLLSVFSLLEFHRRQHTDAPQNQWLWLSGLSFGLLSITISNFIFCLPFILLWLYWSFKEAGRRRLAYMLTFLALALTPLFLVTARNCIYARDCVIVSRNAGSNFYIGNNRDINRTVAMREGAEWIGFKMAPLEGSRIYNYAQLDSSFYRQAGAFISRNPLKWLWLMLKKTALFFNAHEFPRNLDFYFFSGYSSVTRLPLARLGLILPLSIAAISHLYFSRRKTKNWQGAGLILIITLSYSFSIILFFVTARYRLPVLPFLIILSAYYIFSVAGFLKERNLRLAAVMLLCAGASGILAQRRFFEDSYPYKLKPAHTYAQLAKASLTAGNPSQAYRFIRQGLKAGEDDSTHELYAVLGSYYKVQGRKEEAVKSFEKSLKLNPGNFLAYNDAASILAKEGEFDKAEEYFKQAIKIAPCYFASFVGLSACYSKKGDNEAAVSLLASYKEKCPSSHPVIEYYLGKYYMDYFKDLRKAAMHFKNAALHPQFLDRFEIISFDLYDRLGKCYLQLGEVNKAKKIWRLGLKFFPRNSIIRNNLSQAGN